MSETATLVPAPFFAPVRTGTGTLTEFSRNLKRPPLLERWDRIPEPESDAGGVYDREGRFLGETRIGIIVNIYA